MIIDKNFKGLTRNEINDYVFNGNLISDGDVVVELDDRFVVTGDIKAGWDIKAGNGIKAGGNIEAGCDIKAEGNIEIGCDIKAGGDINAGWSIEAGGNINAGCSIEAGGGVEAGCDIKAEGNIEIGGNIEAGGSIESEHGILSQLSIKCKTLSAKLNIFAGTCVWKMPSEEEQQIVCEKLISGTVRYGELVIVKIEEE